VIKHLSAIFHVVRHSMQQAFNALMSLTAEYRPQHANNSERISLGFLVFVFQNIRAVHVIMNLFTRYPFKVLGFQCITVNHSRI